MNKLLDQYIRELNTLDNIFNELITDDKTKYVIKDLIRIVKNLATDTLLQKEGDK